MSALVTPGILHELEQERLHSVDPGEQCRFCRCSQFNPCTILFAQSGSVIRLVFEEAEADYVEPCSWYVPGVCNKPECVEKLLIEARGKVVLFDGTGRRVG
jgi:hypothetical protein